MNEQGELDFSARQMTGYERNEMRFMHWIGTESGQKTAQAVYAAAMKLKAAGWKHYGAKCIVEMLRYQHDVDCGRDSVAGYKIPNAHTAFLSRWLEKYMPELAGFFTKAEQHENNC